ncbi:MAG: hypothetical protein GX615_05140, partial [Lentisphaerae bacterium]|nr:hypothetical protein [Lentisphaerota bacterium]
PPDAAVAAMHSSAPGLWEGIMDYGTNTTVWTADKAAYYTYGTAAVTNGVRDSPHMAYQYGSPWTKLMFVRYQGYIWNRTETAGNWSFALALAGGGKLYIDDEKVLENLSNNWYFLWTNTVAITPGPHKFDLRLYNSGYGGGGCRQPSCTGGGTARFGRSMTTTRGRTTWASPTIRTGAAWLPTPRSTRRTI